MPFISFSRGRRYGLALCVLLGVTAMGNKSDAAQLNLLVPAYAYPGDGSGMWSSLEDTARTLGPRLNVILNPNNGPGDRVDANYRQAVGAVHDAGARVYGYVYTRYGQRDGGEVMQDADRYYTFYDGKVDGIFFDEMSNDLTKVDYYSGLRDQVKGRHQGALVIGNPGTSYLNDSSHGASGHTAQDYLNSADVLALFEDPEADYRDHYHVPEWAAGASPDQVAHIVHTTGTEWDEGLLDLAQQRGAGWIYFTDDGEANPYDRLPAYWDQEVAAVAARNSPVPLPAGLPLFLSGLGLFGLWQRRRRGGAG